ncbi:hypothetical protein ABPG77_011253 [Micractinium sp. CCAP 211/92]
MEPEAVAGDLPVSASPLAQLAAALGPSSNESEGHDPVGGPAAPQGGREAEQDEPEAQEAAASDGGVADVLPLAQAARMFAAACEALHVEPHPQVLLSLNELANEAYGPAMLGKRLGKGGAVLHVPHDVRPCHLQALVALLSGRCGPPPPPGQRSSISAGLEDAPPVGDLFFLRCVHLDLSGHAVPTTLLRELLATGPVRREAKSLTTLRGLDLQGCQLAADVVDLVLLDWKAWAVLERLQQLVLADNPQLGRAAPPVPHQQDAGTNLQQQLQQPAAVAAQPATHGFLGAAKLRGLASRLFSVGQLRLLDLRRTGFEDAAVGFLMRYMATYPVRKLKPREAESPQAPLSDGCRLTLECLKLGPPADGQCFSEQTVAQIAQVLLAAPRLQAVEVLGLAPGSAEALLPVWERAQRARGRQGYAAPSGDGGLRLTVSDDAAPVPAESMPQQHAPLQPPTPEPQQQDETAANLEQEVTRWPDLHARAGAQAAVLQQQGGLPYWQRQSRGLRQPSAGMHRQRPGGGVQFAGLEFDDDDEALGQQPAANRRQHSVEDGGAAGRAGSAGAAATGAGRPRQRAHGGEGTRRSKQPGQRRTAAARGRGGGRSRLDGVERMYRGGAREDELPVGDMLLGSEEAADAGWYYGSQDEGSDYETSDREFIDDDLAATQTGGSSSGDEHAPTAGEPPTRGAAASGARRGARHRIFGAAASDYSSLSEYEGYQSDDYSRHYERNLLRLVNKLKQRDAQAGERASRLRRVWLLAENRYDRRRWQNPSRDQEDLFEHLDALLQLQELLAAHRLFFRFPFPRPKRTWVRARRAELAQRQQQQAQQQPEQQAQRTAHRGPEDGRPRRLQTAAQLEQRALEDSQGAGSDGGGALAAPTQRQLKRKVVVVDDDESDSSGGGASSSSDEGNDGGSARTARRKSSHDHLVAGAGPGAAVTAAAGAQEGTPFCTVGSKDGRPGLKRQRRPGSPGLLGEELAAAVQDVQQAQQRQAHQNQQREEAQRLPSRPLPAPEPTATIVSTQVARAAVAEAADAEAAAVQLHLAFAGRAVTSGQPQQQQQMQQKPGPGAADVADGAAELRVKAPAAGSPVRGSSVIVPDSCSEDEFGL